ncbi:hypothetical protein FOL47_004492 [Perkinsus chesapeaki]|uniref:Uncharacterized protein n=1 Tax=Perkinsus chesapeaki TaxID=330153 RepID=A0A7J6M244_PERCH|nr:hypothetical protein FOL47_004492 [Perkinsus chesapeaki]
MCFDVAKECPPLNYTWDEYFSNLTHLGSANFVLGGYRIINSKIMTRFQDDKPWDKKAFKKLRVMASAKKGSILVDLGVYFEYSAPFDETLFLPSLAEFLSNYSVDGFVISLSPYRDQFSTNLGKALHAISTKSVAALRFQPYNWKEVKEAGLTKYTKINFVPLWPNDDPAVKTFNTEDFADKVVQNASSAGIHMEMVLWWWMPRKVGITISYLKSKQLNEPN